MQSRNPSYFPNCSQITRTLFISENRGAISGSIPKSEGSSTEIPNAIFTEAKNRKQSALHFSRALDYAESKNEKGGDSSAF